MNRILKLKKDTAGISLISAVKEPIMKGQTKGVIKVYSKWYVFNFDTNMCNYQAYLLENGGDSANASEAGLKEVATQLLFDAIDNGNIDAMLKDNNGLYSLDIWNIDIKNPKEYVNRDYSLDSVSSKILFNEFLEDILFSTLDDAETCELYNEYIKDNPDCSENYFCFAIDRFISLVKDFDNGYAINLCGYDYY